MASRRLAFSGFESLMKNTGDASPCPMVTKVRLQARVGMVSGRAGSQTQPRTSARNHSKTAEKNTESIIGGDAAKQAVPYLRKCTVPANGSLR